MVDEIIRELELLTGNKIQSKTTELGFLLEINPQIFIHYIVLKNIKTALDLPSFKNKHHLEHTISLFENEWLEKKEIVLSRIQAKLGLSNRVYARKTTVEKINKADAFEFLKRNHINVAIKAKYNYSLMYQNEIVALAAFGPIMHKKNEGRGELSGELIRFCCKLNYTVVGGLSKLLHHFIAQYKVNDVMTYIDKDWSDGKGFEKLGFKRVGEKTGFAHYFDVEKKQFILETNKDNKTITIYKSGLLKFLLKVKQ